MRTRVCLHGPCLFTTTAAPVTRLSVRGAGLNAKKLDVALGSPSNTSGGGGGLIGPGLAALCLGRNPMLGSAGLNLLVGALLGGTNDEENEGSGVDTGGEGNSMNDSSSERLSTSSSGVGDGGGSGVVAVVPRVVLRSLDLEDCGVKGDAGRSASKLHTAWRKQEKRGGAAVVAAALAKCHQDAATAAAHAAAAADAASAGSDSALPNWTGGDPSSTGSEGDVAADSVPSTAVTASSNTAAPPATAPVSATSTTPLANAAASAAAAAQSAALVASQAPKPLYAHDMLKLPFARLCNQLLASAAYRDQLVSLRLRGNKLGRHASTCLAANFLSSASALRVLDLAYCHLDLAAVVRLGLKPSLDASRATLPPPLLQAKSPPPGASSGAAKPPSGAAPAPATATSSNSAPSSSPRLVGLASTLHTLDLSGSRLPDVAAATLGQFLALGCCGLLRGTPEGAAKLFNDPFFDHDHTSLGANGVAAGPFGEGEGDDGSGLTVAETYYGGNNSSGSKNSSSRKTRKEGWSSVAEDEITAADPLQNGEFSSFDSSSEQPNLRSHQQHNQQNTAAGWPFGGPLRSVILRGVVPGPSGVGGNGVSGDVDYSPMSDRGLEALLMPLMGSVGALCARVTGSLAGTRAAPPSSSSNSSSETAKAAAAATVEAEAEASAVAVSEDEWSWGNEDGGGRGLALDLANNALGTGKLGACLAKCCAHECPPLDLRWTADRVATTYQGKQPIASLGSSSRVVRRRRCSPIASLKLDACALKKKDLVGVLNAITQRHALAGWVGLSLGSAVQVRHALS